MKKIILSCFLLVFASMFISLAEAGEYINNCPVPDNLKIIEPDGNVVPPKLALLSGVWEGSWTCPLSLSWSKSKETKQSLFLLGPVQIQWEEHIQWHHITPALSGKNAQSSRARMETIELFVPSKPGSIN